MRSDSSQLWPTDNVSACKCSDWIPFGRWFKDNVATANYVLVHWYTYNERSRTFGRCQLAILIVSPAVGDDAVGFVAAVTAAAFVGAARRSDSMPFSRAIEGDVALRPILSRPAQPPAASLKRCSVSICWSKLSIR